APGRALEAGPRGGLLRAPAAAPGADDGADRRAAPGAPRPGRCPGRGPGPALLHGDARSSEARREHHHPRGPRNVRGGAVAREAAVPSSVMARPPALAASRELTAGRSHPGPPAKGYNRSP